MNLLIKELQKLTQEEAISRLNEILDYVILCPSRGRAKHILTKRLVPDIVLVVNADEHAEYKKHNPELLVLSPPTSIKGITATRAWMLDNFKNVFMIDDDVTTVKRNYVEPGEKADIEDTELINEIIDYSFYVAKKIGAKMFGFPSTRNPLEYNAFKPFKFTGYYNHSHVGYLEGHGLSFDTSFGEAEDYYMSLMQAYKNRFGFFDCRFTFVTKDNFLSRGGCCEYRTIEMMKKNTLELKRLFGEAVIIKHQSNTKKNINEGERSIHIPF